MNNDQIRELQNLLEESQDADAIIILAVTDAPGDRIEGDENNETIINTFSIHKSGDELNELTLASIYTAAAQNSIARTVDEINAVIESAED